MLVSKYARKDGKLAAPTPPLRRDVHSALKKFHDRVRKRRFRVTPWSFEHFVETRGRKKRVYQAALEKYTRVGVVPADWKVKTFVKAEKLNLTKNPDPAPRVIQPRSPVYNLVVGRYISPLEHILYNIITKIFRHVTVMKGMNARQMGGVIADKWHRLRRPVAVGFDVHRMDQFCTRPLLEWEHSVYKMFIYDKKVRALIKKQLRNVGKAYCYDGKVDYEVDGRRMSGDMNTGLGNCLIMCAVVYSALGEDAEYYLANNGDDCVLFCNEWDLDDFLRRIQAVLDTIGLPTEFEDPVYELEQVEFCQCHPVTDGEEWYMVRDPRTCLDKDACTLKPVRNEREYNILRASVAQSGLACAGHMPVFNEFYSALGRGAGVRVDRDLVETGLKRLAKGMNMNGVSVTTSARVSFFRAFDISPDEQVAMEQHWSTIQPVFADVRVDGVLLSEGLTGSIMGCGV